MEQNEVLIRERIRLTQSLMEHPAWAMLVRDWQEEVDAVKQMLVYNVTGDGATGVLRGKLDVLERLVNLPKILAAIEQGLDGEMDSDE